MINPFRPRYLGPTQVPEAVKADEELGTLARHLEALSSETRLEILRSLRTPRALHEIRVSPSLSRAGESPDRPLSRQAVTRHLEQLMDMGLVRRAPEGAGRVERYVLSHERVFALVDAMRSLTRLRPLTDVPKDATLVGTRSTEPALPELPRLVLVYGRDDGTGYALKGDAGTRWKVGRAPGCDIRLDYDPYLSGENSTIERTQAGYVIRDEAGSQNGTWVNWVRLRPGEARTLRAGDVVLAGRSLLVFQA